MSRIGRIAGCFLALHCGLGVANAAEVGDFTRWDQIREQLYGAKPIEDGSGLIELDAPKRADVAANVPVTLRSILPQTADRYIAKLTLIVDENPAPVVATFATGPKNGNATIGTHIRVNDFSYIHLVAETSDGKLYAIAKYIKSIGGCSAPPMSDQEALSAHLGKMQLTEDEQVEKGAPSHFKFVLGHPNNSGLQFDQISRNYLPAHYINHAEFSFDGQPVLSVVPGISVAEDPTFEFWYVVDHPGTMRVRIQDSRNMHFDADYPVGPGRVKPVPGS